VILRSQGLEPAHT